MKCVNQRFEPDEKLLIIMDIFRKMTNDCIRLGLENNKTSMKSMSVLCYPYLKKYEVNSAYKLCAISRATGILRSYRRTKKKNTNTKIPYCIKPTLTSCYNVRLTKDGYLSIPSKIRIKLNNHTLSILSNPDLEIRSFTVMVNTLSISYKHKMEPVVECTGMLGLDRNLNNITMADTDGSITVFDLGKATEIKAKCKQTKSHFKRNDIRIRRMIYRKYGKKERNKVNWILNNVSKQIVNHAKQNKMAITMEDIRGIRKLYKKGNGRGNKIRGKMSSWSYYELQRQIQYKAEWEGIPVYYVSAWGTSSKCSRCGEKMNTEKNRKLKCSTCSLTIDRDINASRNILARGIENAGLGFKPKESTDEAMIGNVETPLILRANVGESNQREIT